MIDLDEINLAPFCGEDGLNLLAVPFSRGDYTYATDGRILLRVPRRADVLERIAEMPEGV